MITMIRSDPVPYLLFTKSRFLTLSLNQSSLFQLKGDFGPQEGTEESRLWRTAPSYGYFSPSLSLQLVMRGALIIC